MALDWESELQAATDLARATRVMISDRFDDVIGWPCNPVKYAAYQAVSPELPCASQLRVQEWDLVGDDDFIKCFMISVNKKKRQLPSAIELWSHLFGIVGVKHAQESQTIVVMAFHDELVHQFRHEFTSVFTAVQAFCAFARSRSSPHHGARESWMAGYRGLTPGSWEPRAHAAGSEQALRETDVAMFCSAGDGEDVGDPVDCCVAAEDQDERYDRFEIVARICSEVQQRWWLRSRAAQP